VGGLGMGSPPLVDVDTLIFAMAAGRERPSQPAASGVPVPVPSAAAAQPAETPSQAAPPSDGPTSPSPLGTCRPAQRKSNARSRHNSISSTTSAASSSGPIAASATSAQPTNHDRIDSSTVSSVQTEPSLFTPPPAVGFLPSRYSYHALHLCLFVHETCADAAYARETASYKVADWLMKHVPTSLTAVPAMKWTSLPDSNASVGTTSGSSSAGASNPTVQTAAHSTLWSDWLVLHSACAAGDVAFITRYIQQMSCHQLRLSK
jgi:hypothetical protein